MKVTIPSKDELQPLYDAAVEYGRSSMASKEAFDSVAQELNGDYNAVGKSDKLKPFRKKQNESYQKMSDVRKVVNDKYPGIDLDCPAPFVGWDPKLDTYEKHVVSRLVDLIGRAWEKENEAVLEENRKKIRKMQPIEPTDMKVGMIVLLDGYMYRVAKITHSGKRVLAENILNKGTLIPLRPIDPRTGGIYEGAKTYKKISKAIAKVALDLYNSRKALLQECGYWSEPA